jgi:hypothetical protein
VFAILGDPPLSNLVYGLRKKRRHVFTAIERNICRIQGQYRDAIRSAASLLCRFSLRSFGRIMKKAVGRTIDRHCLTSESIALRLRDASLFLFRSLF